MKRKLASIFFIAMVLTGCKSDDGPGRYIVIRTFERTNIKGGKEMSIRTYTREFKNKADAISGTEESFRKAEPTAKHVKVHVERE